MHPADGDDPLDRVDWPVRTGRLLIRRAEPGDGPALFARRRQADVSRWMTRWPRSEAEWERTFTDPAFLRVTLVAEHDGVQVAELMLRPETPYAQVEVADQVKHVEAELGWLVDPAYAGRGLATEAVRALIDTCFGALGMRRVVAHCFADNEPSWRLMERLGMRREGHTVKDALHRELGWVDGYHYALLAEEWR